MLFVAWGVVWLWALYDAVTRPEEVWLAAGESKIMWCLLIVVLQFFGTLFYVLWTRPKLEATSTTT